MNLIKHDIWDVYSKGYTVCICTNSYIKKDGSNVMGRGLALDFAKMFPEFPKIFGKELSKEGNVVMLFEDYRVITFPTKQIWSTPSDLDLIRESCKQLRQIDPNNFKRSVVFLPIPGIGNGKLERSDVIKILEEEIADDDRIVIVEIT